MQSITNHRRGALEREIKRHGVLYLMCVPALTLLIMFAYIPMGGVWMAFTRFNPVDGIFGSPWIGLDNFRFFFQNPQVWRVIGNTLIINFFGLLLGTAVPITIAICMNEVRNKLFKRVSQSAMFFPYFLSWVVIGAIMYSFFTSNIRVDRRTQEIVMSGANGVMNRLLVAIGRDPIRWYAEPRYWKGIIILADVWKWAGYNTIIYMAAMTAFDPALYEAATIDGASRVQQVRYLSLPMLKPTVVVLVLMSIGRIFYGDFGMIWGVVGNNPVLSDAVNVIDTYVYTSMRSMGFSFSTAIGLFQSVMGLILVLGANALARRVNEGEGLF